IYGYRDRRRPPTQRRLDVPDDPGARANDVHRDRSAPSNERRSEQDRRDGQKDVDRIHRLRRATRRVPDFTSRSNTGAALDVARWLDAVRNRSHRVVHVYCPRSQQEPGTLGPRGPWFRVAVLVRGRPALDVRITGWPDAAHAFVGRSLLYRFLPPRLHRGGTAPAQSHGPALAPQLVGRPGRRARCRGPV